MQILKADIVIIGAGSGGLSLAAGAAQMGADVVLFEGGEMGGDCLNTAVCRQRHYWQLEKRHIMRIAKPISAFTLPTRKSILPLPSIM